MQEGEQPVGNQFIHRVCAAENPDGSGTQIRLESSFLRKKGQEGINLETRQVNTGYFESKVRFEMTLPPYSPALAP
jgi:hypothetical protein